MQLPTPSYIKNKRIELNLTQSNLAKKAGVSQPLIARIEHGSVDPKLSTLKKIFDAFESTIKETVFMKDIMHTPIISISSIASVDDAARLIEKHGVSQIPVIDEGVPVGSISEEMIIKSLTNDRASIVPNMKVSEIMGASFPTVSLNTGVYIVSQMLKQIPAVLVMEKGRVVGVVTKYDVIKTLHEY